MRLKPALGWIFWTTEACFKALPYPHDSCTVELDFDLWSRHEEDHFGARRGQRQGGVPECPGCLKTEDADLGYLTV